MLQAQMKLLKNGVKFDGLRNLLIFLIISRIESKIFSHERRK